MTDKQLAVLLYHLMRQINEIHTLAEKAVTDHDSLDVVLWELRGLGDTLESQSKSLNGSNPLLGGGG